LRFARFVTALSTLRGPLPAWLRLCLILPGLELLF
jgi:hypothetical protein